MWNDAGAEPPGRGPEDGRRPRVTVVIPTHNRRVLLERTLSSVLAQEDVDLEVIVVDDGGTDDTARALRERDLSNVRVLRHESSRGVSAARNAGLAVARHPLVAFVDDDDFWAPRKIAAQAAALRSTPAARWSCVAAIHVNADLIPVSYRPPPASGDVCTALSTRNAIPGGGSGLLLETELAREIGGFDEQISILADWDFNLRLCRRSPVAAVEEPLLGYYAHSDSMWHNPFGIWQELQYLAAKHRDTGEAGSFHFDPTFWSVRLAGMAYRLGDRRTTVKLLAHGTRRRGLTPLVAAARARIRRSTPGADRSITEVDGAALSWLAAYRDR